MAFSHPVVCYGEVLWDLLPSGEKPGGAPMNVAYHLHRLGLRPALITRIGRDEHGSRLLGLLEGWGLPTAYVQADPVQPTGLVHATLKSEHEMAYEIVYPSAWDFIEWEDRLEELVGRADYFVFGSLVNRSHASRKTLFRLLEAARAKVLDINLRPPHYDRSIIQDLVSRCQVLKLNEHELPILAQPFTGSSKEEEQLRAVRDHYHLDTVILTKGGAGAAVLRKEGFLQHPGFKVAVRDTVGSGDAFLAGYLSAVIRQKSAGEALEFANSLGAFIATQEGACPEYDTAHIEQGRRNAE